MRTPLNYLGVAQLGARYLGVVEVASSNLVTQIEDRDSYESRFFYLLLTLTNFSFHIIIKKRTRL